MTTRWRRFLGWLCGGPDCWRDVDWDGEMDEYRRKR